MNGTERRVIADAIEPFTASLGIAVAACGCDCDDCYFEQGSVVVEAPDVERLEDALRRVGYEIREIRAPRPCGDPLGVCVYAGPHKGKPHAF